MSFISPTLGTLSLEEMVRNIAAFINEDPQAKYKVVIGTDSHTGSLSTLFVTALIIHRLGKGARFYYQKRSMRKMTDLRHRIYLETELSLKLIDSLKACGLFFVLSEWPIEVHIDIGKQGETRQLIQEVVGWVTSVGYVAKIKPESYGASSVADKFTS
ncbi:protein of unknown function DUF458, RNase H [Caldalkalibacillus thermarum TA2.A1]|uniref:Ribonuclease H-like YkuK family protein n=1 Tax=Caldalkalibacillus thermarum (strain TA2.A1) TaxID=986075 RepID=F5L4B4_CALTT|nr:ribonuclease H-like YkuK family protein [Caldalkalibacillus thermarum]EGL83810.1 protein of unknown function DUF458, RNase H [Caldalkalibacillus thermarum TA2.A1]QZT32859.1 ribonuclease H-like YkuK family protein [Caldalkalibacillus thermarum TA2.A1]